MKLGSTASTYCRILQKPYDLPRSTECLQYVRLSAVAKQGRTLHASRIDFMSYIDTLTVLKAGHRLQRYCNLFLSLADGCLSFMIKIASYCLPAVLSSRLLDTKLFSTARHMVSTRSSRRRNEGIQQIAERLRELPQEEHEPVSDKFAAVLVPLFEDEDGVVKVWLTQRAMHLNSHKGTSVQLTCVLSTVQHSGLAIAQPAQHFQLQRLTGNSAQYTYCLKPVWMAYQPACAKQHGCILLAAILACSQANCMEMCT